MTTNTAALDLSSARDLWGDPEGDNGRDHKTVSPHDLATVADVRIRARDDTWITREFRTIVFRTNIFSELQQIARRYLGYRSARRLKKLVSYETGWDGYDSRSASPFSASLLAAFLTTYASFPTRPSIFLTRSGYLELSWEDRNGQLVSLVFEDDACKVRSDEFEGDVPVFGPYDIQKVAHSLGK